ncbi:amidase [Pseudomonas sp. UL073]|uniref:Amidase n=1 Tax=Zestomonas insulae TaxID=2809017 RepID=A0ABS2IIA7_9GAMM|nr:amidase [Pseudomonas insulae]MBM7062796.1 amidase [Pseudomonas insulae]
MSVFVNQIALGEPGGLRVAIKDSIDIAGQPTCAGSRALANAAPATRNAAVVDALLDAGWHIVGKTNMHELAFGVTGINDWTGTPVNPQAPERVPGGSSSGSAVAVAAGLADVALGTDTGGSVRVPAACCGVFGLKPSFARVSRAGVHPAFTTLDCVGPFAASMAHLSAAMQAICPGFQPFTLQPGAPRVALLEVACDPLIQACLERVIDFVGWQRRDHALEGFTDAFEAGLTVINHETWAAFGHLTGQGLIGADVEQRLLAASRTDAVALAHAELVRARFSQAVDAALATHDVLLLPTLPELPPLLSEARQGRAVGGMTPLARPFNLSGHPALSVPVPLGDGGLKIGLQIVGRKGEDERVCAYGAQLEHALAAVRPTNKNYA